MSTGAKVRVRVIAESLSYTTGEDGKNAERAQYFFGDVFMMDRASAENVLKGNRPGIVLVGDDEPITNPGAPPPLDAAQVALDKENAEKKAAAEKERVDKERADKVKAEQAEAEANAQEEREKREADQKRKLNR